MKILLLANKGSNHAKKVAEGLARKGHNIVLVSPNDIIDESVVIDPGIKLITLPYGGKLGYILNCFALNRLFRKVQPDVVNVHYASGCGFLSFLAGLHPVVLSCYGSDIYEFPNIRKINKWLLLMVLKSANIMASTSHAMADEIRLLLSDNNRQIAITPFGVDIDLFKPRPKEIHKEKIIGIVKALSPIYDIELLIRAFAIVCKRTDTISILRIYGDGPIKKELQQLCIKLGVEHKVEFRGRISNDSVPLALNEMDVFVNCSKQESFGVNILEAMACGVPVIATDCVGPKELIVNGESGIILKDRNAEALANAIIMLLNDESLCHRMGIAGRERVCKYYNWNDNIKDLEKILLENCEKVKKYARH